MLDLEKIVSKLEQYIEDYIGKVTVDNAQNAIDDFDKQWNSVVGYFVDDTSNGQSKYGLALMILSVATLELTNTNEDNVNNLSDLISKYDNDKNVKYKFDIKETLYFNLGTCWHKLGVLYDIKAIEAFKKYVYYLIARSSNISYRPTAYAFRKCTTYLYQSLINDQLNLSSPTTFNDPFDCPIIELLNNRDDVTSLIRKAYQKCLKIACFTSNVKQPYLKDPNNWMSEPIFNEKKHRNDKDEILNSLMWAHYADYHRGICIKYRFDNSISQLGSENENIVSYFKDVKYSESDLSSYSKKQAITLNDAFFLKGKQWEYENELRFLYYDIESNSDYGVVDIPNCIEAIYFGLRCSETDKKTIQNIMSTKEFIEKDLNGNITAKNPIQFFQMEVDLKEFGQLKATKI